MAAEHTEGTLAPGEAHAEGGLPQMNVDTFASQIFWLVVTFVFLMVVLSRLAMPNIRGGLEKRKSQLEGDLGSAQELHHQAAESLKSYETALAGARGRARALADENRKKILAEIEDEKAVADAKAQAAMTAAESRIAETRQSAAAHVRTSAAGAVAEIVERLTGERIGDADAAAAIGGSI